MGKFINTDVNNTNSNQSSLGVQSVSASKQMIADVKSKITIPMYFYNIIVPQLGSYYDNYPVNFDNKIVVCCPLHDEDTPSCRYYEETNSFYCFGCRRGGDTIALHRYFAEKMDGTKPEYEEAVVFLYNYFIKGREQETFIVSTQSKDVKLNSDEDLVKFNIYRYNLEDSISFDTTLRLEVKEQLWEILDNIDVLLSKDIIKATDAEKYIKKKVKELINVDSAIKHIKYRGVQENENYTV